jgi:hypothetical protein
MHSDRIMDFLTINKPIKINIAKIIKLNGRKSGRNYN